MSPRGASDVWPEARLAVLRTLWASGLSTPKIALQLSTTKNAVIARARRLGLPGRQDPVIRAPDDPRRREVVVRVERAGKVTLPPLPSLADVC